MRHIVLLARILCSGAFLFQVFLFSHQSISFPPLLVLTPLQALGAEEIQRSNPVVVAQKVAKI